MVGIREIPAPTWQPIETAPKDGTYVLLYAPASEYKGEPTAPRLTYGCWLVEEHGAYLGDCGGECRCPEYDDPPDPYWFSEDGGFTEENPPTHWMPLPEPPDSVVWMPSETWKVVPAEPTAEMRQAGERAWMNRDLSRPDSDPISDCYRAMLDAVPDLENRKAPLADAHSKNPPEAEHG